MTVSVDTDVVRSASNRVQELGIDVGGAITYAARHLESFDPSRSGGVLFQHILQGHGSYTESTVTALKYVRRINYHLAEALDDVAVLFDATENDAQIAVADLFADLDPTVRTAPLAGSSPLSGTGATSPSKVLATPMSSMDDPAFRLVWSILNWPDYISLTWWARKIIDEVANVAFPRVFHGKGVFEYVEQQFGGDWSALGEAGDAFRNIGDFFDAFGNAVNDAGVHLFQGWDEGAGAATAGEYFAEYVDVLRSQDDVYRDLYTKYNDAAESAFMACSAILSALDACGDAAIAAQLEGITFGEALLAPFTGGVTIATGTVTAIAGVVEILSAAHGLMMTVATGFVAVGAGLGAATQEIEFLPLPGQ